MSNLTFRQAEACDISLLPEVDRDAFSEDWPADLIFTNDMFQSCFETFPEGFFVAIINDRIVGYIITERIHLNVDGELPNWYAMTDNGTIRNSHVCDGNTVVGVSLCVPRSDQGQKIGFGLILKIFDVFGSDETISRGAFGSRISGYHQKQDAMTVDEYIRKVVDRELRDSVLSFYLKMGFQILRPVENFIKDPESCNWGVIMTIDRQKIFDSIKS